LVLGSRHFDCPSSSKQYDAGMSLSARGSVDQGDLAVSFAHLVREDMAVATLIFDSNLTLLFQSPEAARLLGLDSPLLPEAAFEILPPPVRELLHQALHTGKSSTHTETLGKEESRLALLRFSALPLQCGGSSPVVAIVIQDLSLAQRLEGDIRQLDRLASVGTLAAEMAHEVRNALVAVKTFVDLLLEQQPGAELADTVRREMTRIDSIVSQVLKYSRPSALEFQPTGVHAVLERSLRMVKPRCEGRNITVVTRLAASPDKVRGNESYLEQAVLNLLLNATEAMNGDGTLTVETDLIANHGEAPMQTMAEKQVRIVIRDTGGGISSEEMAHLFEPFYSTKRNGTGLGLAITRRIIHEHHGLISAESEPGRGASFQILLPAA
jgi:signal transduction histidine kinase